VAQVGNPRRIRYHPHPFGGLEVPGSAQKSVAAAALITLTLIACGNGEANNGADAGGLFGVGLGGDTGTSTDTKADVKTDAKTDTLTDTKTDVPLDATDIQQDATKTADTAVPDTDGAGADTDVAVAPDVPKDVPAQPCVPVVDDCNDKNPCTLDACSAESSTCTHDPAPMDGKPCNADDNGCSQGDSCAQGKCTPGPQPDCGLTTTEPCVAGVCVSIGKLTFECKVQKTPPGGPCDDGAFCTAPDTCDENGACKPGPPKACADAGPCQAALCDEGGKKCNPTPKADNVPCDDGDSCTGPDFCKGGTCTAGGSACGDFKVSALKPAAGTKVAAAGDLGNGRFRVAWPGEGGTGQGGTIWTRAFRADGSREATEHLVATVPAGETLLGVQVLNAGNGQSDVLWASDGAGKAESCWYHKLLGICASPCYPTQAACGSAQGFGNCLQGTRHTPASHISWQRFDALHQPMGAPVAVLQQAGTCATGSPQPNLSAVAATVLPDGHRFVAWTVKDGTQKVLLASGGALQKNLGKDKDQKFPAAAAFSDGRVLLAWEQGDDVWAQMYASSGDKDGTPFQVNTQAAGKQSAPVVAALPNGRSVVAWQTDQGEGDVKAQIFKQEPGLPLGGEIQVNAQGVGPQARPAIAMFTDGSFAIAWEDGKGQDGSGWGLVAQWFNPTGGKVGGEKVLDTASAGDQRFVAAAGQQDEAVFAWTNLENGSHVHARRYDKTGASLAGNPETVANQQKTGDQTGPALVSWPGGFALAWESEGQDGDGSAIVLRRFGETGQPAGSEAVVNSTTAGPQLHPTLGADANGNLVLAWDSFNQDGDLEAIVFQRFDKQGAKQGGEVVANQATLNEQQRPAVAVHPDGKFAVAWESFAQKGGQSYDVLLRCYEADGTALGPEQIANEYAGDKQLATHVQALPGGKLVQVWQSYGEDGSEWGIVGQLWAPGCTKSGAPFAANTSKTGEQSQARVAANPDGSFVVAWRSAGQDGSGFGVYAQLFGGNGSKLGGEFKLNPVTENEQSKPALACGGPLLLAVWQTISEDEEGMAVKAAFRTDKGQQGADFLANLTYAGNQQLPVVASLQNGSFAVAWTSQGQDGDKGGIVVRTVKP
jgi:hypothetical protein